MTFTEQAKSLAEQEDAMEGYKNLASDTIAALLGDPISAGKAILTLLKSPFMIREQLFWAKLEVFLNGVYLSEDDRGKLRALLSQDGKETENANRLIACIDRVETNKKIQFMINATRCLLVSFIDLPLYFRICHLISNTLEEDLIFLADNITSDVNFEYETSVQGLLTSGLVYQSVIDVNGTNEYSFTPIARDIDRYAISYENMERYPDPTANLTTLRIPQPQITAVANFG